MKRSLFKQIMVSALFACGLSADVPDVREQAEDGRSRPLGESGTDDGGRTAESRGRMTEVGQISKRPTSNVERPMTAGGLAANWTETYSFDLYNGSAIRPLLFAVCRPAGMAPDPMAAMLSAVWPLDTVGRSCAQWDVLPSVSPEAINVSMDPLDAALLVPRYWMPLALQESAWPCPAGFGEPALSLDVACPTGRADMAAMIPRLKKIFTKEGVPHQWVWMAEVESALNPRAKSSAGAAGLFQLMPDTARRFGLQMTPVDDRMEPEKSAGAAAQYLKFLRREFGCWSLALAAYNAGEGRVKEIMKKRKARTFNEVERYLPSETRAYVPKVMAAVALREDQLHGVPGAYWMP